MKKPVKVAFLSSQVPVTGVVPQLPVGSWMYFAVKLYISPSTANKSTKAPLALQT